MLTDPTDILREQVSKYICSKYNLPAFVINHGKYVTVLCCCQEFANELRSEIKKTTGKEMEDLKIHFVTGNVEFV